MIILITAIFLLILILLYAYIKQFDSDRSLFYKLIIAFFVVVFTLSVIIYPEESMSASLDGLKTWFNIVLPSLLPFFIGSDLLIALGVVDFLGALLEPVMRPLFNVPGCGSFPFVMSITSGYPVGARIISELYKNKKCTKTEAQRMLSFCSTSGPLFMIGAVGIGMLKLKTGGTVIAISQYLGAITVGIIYRWYKFSQNTVCPTGMGGFKKAFASLIQSINKEKRPLGQLLSDSVKNSVNSLLAIGGFIILFSVIIRLLIKSGFITVLSSLVYCIFKPIGFESQLTVPFTSGLFEMTIGSKLIAATRAAVSQKIVCISALIAWSGFSIHAQVASMLSGTDLKLGTYMISKVLHSLLSGIYAYFMVTSIKIPDMSKTLQVFAGGAADFEVDSSWITKLAASFEKIFMSLIILILLYVTVRLINTIIYRFNRSSS